MEDDKGFFLEREIESLTSENIQLRKHLAAKRYKFADKVVDTAYKFIPRPRSKNKEKLDDAEQLARKWKQRSYTKKRVDIVNHNFYDWDGKIVYKGGAERYVYDLALLLRSMGYQVRILQGANRAFEKTYRDIPIVGVEAGVKPGDYRGLSKKYNEFCRDAEFIIASPNELASDITDVPCIGINHGVNFDGIWTSAAYTLMREHETQVDSIRNSECCVCVDTNYINWMRTKDYKLSQKLVYIPNYYNEKTFKHTPKASKDGKIVFVYPRRIYEPRGYDITIKAFQNILKKHKNVELRFIGQIDNEKAKQDIDDFLASFPDNVLHREYAMEDAYKAYEDADVVLVPTRYSEGTSLSCIEGQASGLPVIATNIGGLPNLILDHYNGLLISPSARALEQAALELIENPKLRQEMARHSLDVAKSAFEKRLWDQRWKTVVKDFTSRAD